MLSLAMRTASSSSREGLDGQHRAERLVLGDRHGARAAVEDRRQVVEAVGQRRVVGPGAAAVRSTAPSAIPRATYASTLSRCAALVSGPVSALSSKGPPSRIVAARSTSRSTNSSWIDSSTTSRAPGRADLARVQEDRREREVEGDLEVGVGEHHVGVLAAELERHPLHRPGRGRHQPPAGLQTAGEGDQVDPRVGRQGCAGGRAGAEDQVADAGRQAGLRQQPHQVDRGVRRQLARLEDEGVAGREAGRDLPGDLEQRVVPRRDQRADADRLVHDPADDVRVAGVDHPAGVLGRDPAVVAEHRDHVGDVVAALDQALAGVERLHPGQVLGVALEQVGQPHQQVAALAGRRAPARGRRGRRRAPRRSRPRCPRRRPRRPRRPACRRPGSGSRGVLHPARSPTRRQGRARPLGLTPRTTTQLRITQPSACRATGSFDLRMLSGTRPSRGASPM